MVDYCRIRIQNKPALCRRCEMERQASGAKPSSSATVSAGTKRHSSSHPKPQAEKKPKPEAAASKPTTSVRAAAAGAESSDASVHAEHVVTIQQLKDSIFELNRTVRERDQQLQEKDRKVFLSSIASF